MWGFGGGRFWTHLRLHCATATTSSHRGRVPLRRDTNSGAWGEGFRWEVALGLVTADHRLYIWGHPSNRKLGHVGFNHDGTEAGEDPGIGAKQKSKARPPGVAVRSALRDAVRRPRMVFALLHRRVRTLGLGEECTVIVHGDGKEPDEQPQEVQDVQVQSVAIPDLEAALPVEAENESHPLEEAQPPKDTPQDTRFSL